MKSIPVVIEVLAADEAYFLEHGVGERGRDEEAGAVGKRLGFIGRSWDVATRATENTKF